MRSAQSSLTVDVRPLADEGAGGAEGGGVLVRLDGELDITSSPLLLTVVEQILAARRHPPCVLLVVDMSSVAFADASGISPLLLARATLVRRGGRVELRHCRRSVRRLLRVLGLEDMCSEPVAEEQHSLG